MDNIDNNGNIDIISNEDNLVKEMSLENMEAAIEAVLFTMGEAVELDRLAAAIEQDAETTRKLVHDMMDD